MDYCTAKDMMVCRSHANNMNMITHRYWPLLVKLMWPLQHVEHQPLHLTSPVPPPQIRS